MHDFAYNLNDKKQTDAILLDFCKAFDKVSHRHFKIKAGLLRSQKPNSKVDILFLGRTHPVCVVCGGYTSDPANVISGVPQGTILGPLLFLIYINDLPECVSSMCSLFANDCLVYRKIESDRDIKILQNDLSNLELWVRKWLMTFDTDKCEFLQITCTLKPVTPNSYTLYGKHLKEVTEAKYLGVTLLIVNSLDLSPSILILYVAKKAIFTLAFIQQNLKSCQRQIKVDAYLMYVRLILEYAVVIWAPHTGCDIERLEAVRGRVARFVMSDYNLTSSVTVMLQDLNWDTLSSRRQTSRLCLLYKILHNIVDVKLPCQAISHHQLDSQEVTIKNSSRPNLELMHVSLISFQIH